MVTKKLNGHLKKELRPTLGNLAALCTILLLLLGGINWLINVNVHGSAAVIQTKAIVKEIVRVHDQSRDAHSGMIAEQRDSIISISRTMQQVHQQLDRIERLANGDSP